MKKHLFYKGFTLIEVVVVLAIVGALVAVVSFPFLRFREAQALENSAAGLIAVLNDARAKTLASVGNTQHSIKLESDRATLFSGTVYDANATTNEYYYYDTPVTATNALQGGATTVIFDRLKGTTAQYGTITLSLPNGTTKVVTIGASGSVVRN